MSSFILKFVSGLIEIRWMDVVVVVIIKNCQNSQIFWFYPDHERWRQLLQLPVFVVVFFVDNSTILQGKI